MAEADQDALLTALVSAPAGALGQAVPRSDDGARSGHATAPDDDGDPAARPRFTAREVAILAYADQVTVDPASVTQADIAPLREAGLDDRAIHDVCAITAYYAFVNRMADGLGVELEPDRDWKDGRRDG